MTSGCPALPPPEVIKAMGSTSASFGATSTADEVIEGVDLYGRRILVTGVSSGTGVETARVLAVHGAHVVGTARDLTKARRATQQIGVQTQSDGDFELIALDLASLASIRACADELLKSSRRFDVVAANAGVMASPHGITADGFETQFGTNHLGHFVFVNRIAGLINPGGRLVTLASAGHRGADIDLDEPNFEHTPYDPLVAYRRSKTATILFAVEFDRRHEAGGVRATAVHPGAVLTETTRTMIENQPAAAAAFRWKTVKQGPATSAWAGCVAAADQIGGRYCEDCRVADINDRPADTFGVRTYALDPRHAKALWIRSEEMVGERF